MKLKKIEKSFLSLFLTFGISVSMLNVCLCSGKVYAADQKSVCGSFWSKTIRCFCGIIDDIFFYFWDKPYYILKQNSEDLVEAAKKGQIHDCVGKDKEIDDLLHFLFNEDKGNTMIVSDNESDGAAVVEGLAYRIANGNVPEYFKNKRIIRINMVSLIAGNTYSGSDRAAARVRGIFSAAEKNPDIILFIDELHQLAKMNVTDLFKAYLESGRVKMITATTTKEYEYIKSDVALTKFFNMLLFN